MSINVEFVSADEVVDLLQEAEVTQDQESSGMRVRHLTMPGGKVVVLVEGGAGGYGLIRL